MPTDFRLADFLPYRLSVLANTVSATLARRYADRFRLSVHEWRVMAALGESPGMSAEEVGRHTCMDKVTVSRAVRRLQSDGRLRRTVSREDRRRQHLTLTAAGRRVYEDIVPLARDYEQQLLATMSAADRARLAAVLDSLTEHAATLEHTFDPTEDKGLRRSA